MILIDFLSLKTNPQIKLLYLVTSHFEKIELEVTKNGTFGYF